MRNVFSTSGGAVVPRPGAPSHAAQPAPTLLPTPEMLQRQYPATAQVLATVATGRQQARAILDRQDSRLLVIVGPCSIHDPHAAWDYACLLAELARELSASMCILMRVYFEKPRTTLGWKGLLHDPRLDGSAGMDEGLAAARQLLVHVNMLGLPAATELLHPLTVAWLGDLLSWAAIGARTTESQVHRELASGLPMPVGFKNGTDGDVGIALQALQASAVPHALPGIDMQGRAIVQHTQGNAHAHLVLRGGSQGPNYDAASIARACAMLDEKRLSRRMVVDCSHANCGKQAARQADVLRDVVAQRCAGRQALRGVMLESFLVGGNQVLGADPRTLRYGCSITDPCLDWPATASLLREAHQRLQAAACAPFMHAAPEMVPVRPWV
ncbi:MAG: 3-deoxy-7-phosphoheptulonate synthase [Pseudomonadota bacterium]|nr:3-deoxy-7-phosphoheptulonate synthase [Pseudomonadota bacterium]